jgi:hypothetical protein
MLATMCVPLAGCALTSLRTAEQPTTGDKLRAIHAAAHGDGAWIQPGFTEQEVILRLANAPRWCADLRTRLFSNPPSMYAEVDTDRTADDPPLSPASYPIDAPGLYPPVDRERADLARAHAAGLLSDAELAELLATLEAQASRPAFRRASEQAPARDATRARDQWLRAWLEAYANVERVPGAELPCTDPNPPAERSTRAWRRPDFWVDPLAATTR